MDAPGQQEARRNRCAKGTAPSSRSKRLGGILPSLLTAVRVHQPKTHVTHDTPPPDRNDDDDSLGEHHAFLRELAARDDLRVAKYAQALLDDDATDGDGDAGGRS